MPSARRSSSSRSLQDLEFRQLIERIKLRSPIEVLVGERVTGLRQRGSLWWARCPFHEERTPSFAVDPRRGTWRCYGACGEGGDVLSFIQRFDGLSFLDALRLLAQQSGEELPDRVLRGEGRGTDPELEARFDLLRWAGDFYRRALNGPQGEEARAYLRGRGLREEVLKEFGVGWAPGEGQALLAAAQRDGKPVDGLAEVGLLRRGDTGRPYDFFRARVLVPIRDRLGRIVGLGGRILPALERGDASVPKYINTPETRLFHKGRVIFGLDLALGEVRRGGQLLIVEGYTDVMAAHQAGWKSAVAVLGTATTEEHAALVRRSGARRVTLVFDGDEAGRRASARALAGLLNLDVELRVAVLPEGRDPGDLLVEPAGAAEFRTRIEAARDWFDWSLEDLAGKRGRELLAAVEERFLLLLRLGRPLERSARLAEMARFLGLPEADVRAQWQAFERAQRAPVRAPEAAASRVRPAANSPGAGPERAFALLIGSLLLDNSLIPLYAQLLEHCPEGDLRLLFGALLELHGRDEGGEPIDASAVMTALGDHPVRERVVLLQALAERAESPEVLARDQERWIAEWRRGPELERLKGALRSADPSSAEDGTEDVLTRLHHELRIGRVSSPKTASVHSP